MTYCIRTAQSATIFGMPVDDTSDSQCFACKDLASRCSSCTRAHDEANVAERIRRAQLLEEAGCTQAQVLAIVLGRAARA